MTGLWRAALLYTVLTIALAYPLSIHPASTVLSPGPDTNAFLWALEWDVHALVHQPLAIFDANIYYPEHHTLAYTENLLGSAPIAAPILWLTGGNAVLAMNAVVLLACVLCGLGTYVLARQLGVDASGALLAGLIFAFSPPRFLRLDQVHLATIEWVPFGLASLHAYWDEGRARDARLAAGFFALQALTSGHGAVFLLVGAGTLLSCRLVRGESRFSLGWIRDLGLPGVLLLVPVGLVLLPYRIVQHDMGLRRSLENWAVPWTSFLASSTHVDGFLAALVPSLHVNDTIGPQLFPGWIPLTLAACACMWPATSQFAGRRSVRLWSYLSRAAEAVTVAGVVLGVAVWVTGASRLTVGGTVVLSLRQAWRPWAIAVLAAAARVAMAGKVPLAAGERVARAWRGVRSGREPGRGRPAPVLAYALVTLVGLWLAAGPPIGLWPLVYWLPGLNFIRAPSRFTLLSVLGIGVLAGIGFERLTARLSEHRRALAAAVVGALLVGEFAAGPFEVQAYHADPPAVDRWLAGRPRPFVVAEVPVGDPGNLGEWERLESGYMLHAAAHWQPTVHGYSGFRSEMHDVLYRRLTGFPDADSLQSLEALGVSYIVVHADLYHPGEWDAVAARLARFGRALKLERIDGDGRVYSLTRER